MAFHRIQPSVYFKREVATLLREYKYIRCSVAFEMQQAVKFPRKIVRFYPIYTESCLRRRIEIRNGVATPNLGETCFQDGSYSDLLLHGRRLKVNQVGLRAPVTQHERITERSFTVHTFLIQGMRVLRLFLAVCL
jgi:hypothetical protein